MSDKPFDDLAYRIWSVHPREIQDMGISRQEFVRRSIYQAFCERNGPPVAWLMTFSDGTVKAVADELDTIGKGWISCEPLVRCHPTGVPQSPKVTA